MDLSLPKMELELCDKEEEMEQEPEQEVQDTVEKLPNIRAQKNLRKVSYHWGWGSRNRYYLAQNNCLKVRICQNIFFFMKECIRHGSLPEKLNYMYVPDRVRVGILGSSADVLWSRT